MNTLCTYFQRAYNQLGKDEKYYFLGKQEANTDLRNQESSSEQIQRFGSPTTSMIQNTYKSKEKSTDMERTENHTVLADVGEQDRSNGPLSAPKSKLDLNSDGAELYDLS